MITPFSPSGPKRTGFPCSNGTSIEGRLSLDVIASKAPSLKTLQFWYTSTKEAPLCSYARRKVSVMCLRSISCVRATKEASAPRASEMGL